MAQSMEGMSMTAAAAVEGIGSFDGEVPTELREGMVIENPVIEPELEQIEQLEQSTELVVQRAQAITISNGADYDAAGEFLTAELKPMLKEISDTFGPIITATNKAHKAAVAQKKRHSKPLLEAEEIVKASMGVYHLEQKEIERQAERERLAVARREAEERALAEAAELEEMGEDDAAEEIISMPATPVVVKPAPAPPKTAGVSVRTKSKHRIINVAAIDRKFTMPDEKKIAQVVRSMGKDAEMIVGGIEVYEVPIVSARAR
jgi:hypothetical protein